MKILYIHHAEKDRFNKNVPRQLQDITENGIKESELLADKIKNFNITAIYTSPYLRCIHTAEIINKYNNIPIYEEHKFNEIENGETWCEFQIRNMEALLMILLKNTMILILLYVYQAV